MTLLLNEPVARVPALVSWLLASIYSLMDQERRVPAVDLNSVFPPSLATAAGGSSDNQEGIVAKKKRKAAGVSVICPGLTEPCPMCAGLSVVVHNRCKAATLMMEKPNDRP